MNQTFLLVEPPFLLLKSTIFDAEDTIFGGSPRSKHGWRTRTTQGKLVVFGPFPQPCGKLAGGSSGARRIEQKLGDLTDSILI